MNSRALIGSTELWYLLLASICLATFLFFNTKRRLKFYQSQTERGLLKIDPFSSNIYFFSIIITFFYIVRDLISIFIDIDAFGCIFGKDSMDGDYNNESGSCYGDYFSSSIISSNHYSGGIDIDLLTYYLLTMCIPLLWVGWALIKEYEINRAFREVRLMALNQKFSLSNSRNAQEPEQLAAVIEAEAIPKNEEGNPATVEQVLAAMDVELKRAIRAAEMLQVELDETKEKVELLEEEVQIRDEEIQQIKDSKSNLDKLITENNSNDDSGKSLSLTDSVMVGDSVMGGVKIDKQINNDPEAIAKAVIEAYRKGLDDS